jgi:pimeloyl-ACP methyl ester carboxylesterase
MRKEETIVTQVEANGIQIEYETFGEPDSPALLLIIGIIGQLTFWDEKLCRQLAQQGHYVIRFDNRDAGLSSRIEDVGVPDIMQTFKTQMKGETIKAPYTIEDMADDAVGLLDALGIEKAHICGMSMGGMIAQTIAINYPKRVLSLLSIYSRTGDPEEPQPEPEAREFLLAPSTEEREAYIEHGIKFFSTISGPGFPYDEEWLRNFVAQSYDRAYNPGGVARQLVAILAQKNRRPELKSLSTPALVIHGADDSLVLVEGGKNTAADIPGAELLIIDGMGHDLPHAGAWLKIIDAIADFTREIGT